MKTTGIVRKLDELGRIVLPMELRKTLNLQIRDSIEITADKDTIFLRKYSSSCIFCSKEDELSDFKGKLVCRKCLDEIKN
ncbi:MAG: AbrB/MazE/SpoVT family DNA-binding domain-containing protein [Clostridia bacterium]|nr:AbrB/MazE/SpoVT family DNA-binding domain-containing protein [Clostridia bacterium]MDD4375382.1 AbrB/MazE/SpoVT family DNA-binding domain-containing protein [Clostridia bacterium]